MQALRKINLLFALFVVFGAFNVYAGTQVWAPFFTVNGVLKASGLKYPTVDGSAGQAIVTNGSGILSFTTIGAGASAWTLNGSQLYATNTAYVVGIGHTNPVRKLDVVGASNYPARFKGTLHTILEIYANGYNQAGFRLGTGTKDLWYWDCYGNDASRRFRLRDSTTTEVFTVLHGGKFGFNKTVPENTIHAYNSTSNGACFIFEGTGTATALQSRNETSTQDPVIQLKGYGLSNYWSIGIDDSGSDPFILTHSANMQSDIALQIQDGTGIVTIGPTLSPTPADSLLNVEQGAHIARGLLVGGKIYKGSQVADSTVATWGYVAAHGGGGGDFSAADFGDSLTNYDGYGVTITDNADIEVDTSAIATVYDVSLKATSGGAEHDNFSDFVANEHVNHTSVTLTAGNGLSGGGDISANRTFNVDRSVLITNGTTDSIATEDAVFDFCETTQDYVKNSETSAWDKSATDDLMKAHFGDSLLNYDGAGLTISDLNAINVNIATTVTDNETDSLPSSNSVYDFCETTQDYHKTSEFNAVSTYETKLIDNPVSALSDTLWLFSNFVGATWSLDSIKVTSEDSCDLIFVSSTWSGGAAARIDSFRVNTAGAPDYYHTETTLTASSLATNKKMGIVRPDDITDFVQINLFYHYTRP